MKIITVVEVNNIAGFPPVQNLIKILLNKQYQVNFIGNNLNCISDDIKQNPNYTGYEISSYPQTKSFSKKAINKIAIFLKLKKIVPKCMDTSEFLWTTSMDTIVLIGGKVLKYKNIMQLMELINYASIYRGKIKVPVQIAHIAQHSWKTVVPEINRAYIQKVWWNLPRVPYVLPNKPYSIDYGEITKELCPAIEKMKAEKKKIILYLGVVGSDRNLEKLAMAINKSDDYVLYIVARTFSNEDQEMLKTLQNNYNCVYVGGFNPPKHLALVKYAHIGLLPYVAAKVPGLSELNALYCAPNKIWEYAGFGVPMVGSDVLGLKLPFEQWNIGRCCDLNDEDSIIKAIEEVDRNHDEMSKNCYKFYDSVDLEKIVSEILEDKN